MHDNVHKIKGRCLYNASTYLHRSSIGSQKSNEVTFTRNINSATAGSLDDSAVFSIRADRFRAYNVDFHNTYGAGAQAVAVSARGDLQGYYACGFYGYQDTLYARSGRQYYSNCYVEGAVDYIFGAAAAWFGECTVYSNGAGYVTANSREEAGDASWYVFDNSVVTGQSGLTGKVYLGRPWRVLARVIYQNSELGGVVHPEGYTTMADGATPEYREFANTGDGADTSGRKCKCIISCHVYADAESAAGLRDQGSADMGSTDHSRSDHSDECGRYQE